jgi:hypothetical protein
MVQKQANQNQHLRQFPIAVDEQEICSLLKLGFTQDEIDYAFATVWTGYALAFDRLDQKLSDALDEDDSQFFVSFDCGVPENVTEEKVCNTFESSQNDLLTEIVERKIENA